MTNHKKTLRNKNGVYNINGKTFPELCGSRVKVFNGTAYKTKGDLHRADLIRNKWGRIVSKKKHTTAKKENRLKKHGFTAKKGHFGSVKIVKRKK